MNNEIVRGLVLNAKQSTVQVVSLFSGCGGLDLGVEGGFSVRSQCNNFHSENNWVRLPETRFKVVLANDIMPQARRVWESNFEGEYLPDSIVDLVEQNYAFPAADLVIGGFPCQDFSVAGKRSGFTSERGSLYSSMVKVVQKVNPKAFIAENVYGLLSIPNAKERIIQDFESIGYRVYCYCLSAEDYGVPQTRKRVFFIGLNKKHLQRSVALEEIIPQATHQTPVALQHIFADLQEPDATGDLEQQSYSKAKWYGRKCQGNTEIDLSHCGPTIRAEHHGNIEFRRLALEHGGRQIEEINQGMIERRLTIRECARIQTFPDDFHIMTDGKGKKTISTSASYKVLGNAVPPLLGYHVAKKIDSIWESLF